MTFWNKQVGGRAAGAVRLFGLFSVIAAVAWGTASTPSAVAADRAAAYPPTRVESVWDQIHGVEVADPYRWLEDAKSPEVQQWMDAQDSLARAMLRALPHREKIAARLRELSYIDVIDAPLKRGKRYFYKRRNAKQEKSVLYCREGKKGAERALLDPNAWSADGNWSLNRWVPSWDGEKVAYTVSRNFADEATLYVLDVTTGKRSEIDVIEGARYGSASWTPENDAFYYTWIPTDSTIPPAAVPGHMEIRFHRLGQDPKRDEQIRERTGDSGVFQGAALSRDGHWLFWVRSHGWKTTDVYFKDMRRGRQGDFVPLTVGQDAMYYVRAFKDRFYLLTNEGAPRWCVYRVDPARPARENWVKVVPERADATLDDFTIAGSRLVLTYIVDASTRLETRGLDGGKPREIALPGIGTVKNITGSDDDDEAFFEFESFTTPKEIYELGVGSRKTRLWDRIRVPIDATPYTVDRIFVTSKDGARVPVFLVHRRDIVRDGSSPLLLTGYGGFQQGQSPYFSARSYVWLERGGTYALACIRGGNEYGEEWHRAGMLEKKQNVFDDFIAVSESLIRERYTSPDRLVIMGGSNAGLLVGAAMTQRPDLYRGVVCSAPLLDMVRYHRFGAGSTWVGEYGSADDSTQFEALLAYSPYHHVKAGVKYPPTLMMSADSDDRVDPMHARKFTAALQDADGGPVYLRIEREAGHRGADRVRSSVESGADLYAFLLSLVSGRAEPAKAAAP